MDAMNDVTELLSRIDDDPVAAEQLLPLVYHQLRDLALAKLRNERPDHTLQATALVHEAYLRLVGQPDNQEPAFAGRSHFFGAAAEAMRRILIENVRRRKSKKRGGDNLQVSLSGLNVDPEKVDERIIAMDDALSKFELIDPVKANLVKLRFFAGLTQADAAETLGISLATADRYWAFARAWLKTRMQES